jgi:hypothetical protein
VSTGRRAGGRGCRAEGMGKGKNAKLNKCDCQVARLHDNSGSGDRTGKPMVILSIYSLVKSSLTSFSRTGRSCSTISQITSADMLSYA